MTLPVVWEKVTERARSKVCLKFIIAIASTACLRRHHLLLNSYSSKLYKGYKVANAAKQNNNCTCAQKTLEVRIILFHRNIKLKLFGIHVYTCTLKNTANWISLGLNQITHKAGQLKIKVIGKSNVAFLLH